MRRAWLGLFLAIAGCSPSAITIAPPRIAADGRTIAIGVTLANPQHIIAASETGGLFQTYDGGTSWLHVQNFPSYQPIDVAVSTTSPDVIIATARSQYRVVNDGGIWRSTDGGASWHQPTGWAPPPGPNCPSHPSAYGISHMPLTNTWYVGTDCGLAITNDDGATWTSIVPVPGIAFDSVSNRVHSVLVINPTAGVAVGDRGLWYLTPKGVWTTSAQNPDSGQTPPTHGFASPWFTGTSNVFFHASIDHELWLSTDGGADWTQVSAPSGPYRESFVRVARSVSGDDTKFDVYFGDGSQMRRQSFVAAGTTATSWTELTVDHSDPNDVGFDREFRNPVLLATDGGVHVTTDQGSTWTLTGAAYNGFDALQIAEIDGQYVSGPSPHLDLYFGTQDNLIWASADGGATWPHSICCEGKYMRIGARGSFEQELKVVGAACGPCSNFFIDPQFDSVGPSGPPPFPNAPNGKPSDPADTPFQLLNDVYVQDVVNQSTSPPSFDFYFTMSAGALWVKRFSFSGAPVGNATFAGPVLNPTMYEGVQRPGSLSNGGTLYGINRVTNITGAAIVTRADSIGIGGVGSLHTPIARYIVFGVDPNNPAHLIAPDVETGDMRFSADSGVHWYALPQLTQAVTDSGQFLFTLAELSLASVIQWDPYDSCRILVGTLENGVIQSTDGGNTWAKIPGTELASNVSGFFFPPSGSVWMSTDGRGLFTVSLNRPNGGSGQKCSFPSPPSRFPIVTTVGVSPSGGVTTFSGLRDTIVCPKCSVVTVRNGWVTGLTMAGDTVKRVAISGGTITRVTPAGREVPLGVGNTYRAGTFVLPGRASRTELSGTRRVRALVLEGNILKLLVVSSADLPFAPATTPTAVVSSANRPGSRSIAANDPVRVVGAQFTPPARGGRPVRILFDGATVDSTVAVRADGSFSVDLPEHHAPGELVITALQQDGSRLTQARAILEIAGDEPERREPKR